ncbi:MAG TPA: hypothetical protein VGK73_24015 [Polyangiaceae bacterium]
MNKKHIALTALCLLAAVGCSAAETGSAQEDGVAEADGTTAEAFATIEVGEQQVTFFDSGDGGILVGSAKSNFDPEFAIVQLERTAGMELTPLELFSALAPGEAAPEQLVEDHAARVAALGRADATVLQIAYEPQQLIEKAWTPTQCDNALGLTAAGVIRRNNQLVIDYCTANLTASPGCETYVPTARHRAGVCNNSPTLSMTTKAHTRDTSSSWRTSTASVVPNGSYLWTAWGRLNGDLTQWIPSKLRLQAWAADSNWFHARLAPN